MLAYSHSYRVFDEIIIIIIIFIIIRLSKQQQTEAGFRLKY